MRITGAAAMAAGDTCLLFNDGTSAYLIFDTDRRFSETEIMARYRAVFDDTWVVIDECPGGNSCLEGGSAVSLKRDIASASIVMSNYENHGSYEITVAASDR